MSKSRVIMPTGSDGLYLVTNRLIANPDRIFGDTEKQKLFSLMLAYANFSNIQIVAWCVMDDHFHMLLRVPGNASDMTTMLTATDILKRMKLIYTPAELAVITEAIAKKSPAAREEFFETYRRRIGSLAMFVRIVKQRFTQWYNGKHQRVGTLWQERYKSVVVEMEKANSLGHAARVMAAYIDLNPVRAGLVNDPKDYPWCGFARACQGDKPSLNAISCLFGIPPKPAMVSYGDMIGSSQSATSNPNAGGPISSTDARARWHDRKPGEILPLQIMLRLSTRYFTDGTIIGSPDFVHSVSSAHGHGTTAKPGKKMRFGDWGGLHSLRNLRTNVIH